jgi:hypothetical protein
VATSTPAATQPDEEESAFAALLEHLGGAETFQHLGTATKVDLVRLGELLREWRKHLL